MADKTPLKAGATGIEQFTTGDTIPASLIGIVPKFEVPSGTVNGSNAVFTLSATPVANASVIMTLDGVVQTNGTDYTVSGTTVTFTTAPTSGTEVVAIYNSAASAGGGDFSSNTSSAVDSEVVLFSGTGGKTGKRATGSGYAKLTSGVLSALTAAVLRGEIESEVITPAQITSDQDNYSPTGWATANRVRISGDNGIRAITSFSASGISDGHSKMLEIGGSFPVYIPGEHPDGTAANRVNASQDLICFPGDSVNLVYNTTTSRWAAYLLNSQIRIGRIINYSLSPGTSTAADNAIWAFLAFGTGTVTATASASGFPACYLLGTSTSATAGYVIHFVKTIFTFSFLSNAHIWADFFISLPTLSDGTQTYTIAAQITTGVTTASESPSNTIGIRYGSAVNSGKFLGFSRDNAGAESTVDLGITVVADTLYRLRVEIDKSKTEARFYIDGVMLGRVTGNLPNSVVVGTRVVILKSAGTTARTLRLHSMTTGAIYP